MLSLFLPEFVVTCPSRLHLDAEMLSGLSIPMLVQRQQHTVLSKFEGIVLKLANVVY